MNETLPSDAILTHPPKTGLYITYIGNDAGYWFFVGVAKWFVRSANNTTVAYYTTNLDQEDLGPYANHHTSGPCYSDSKVAYIPK